MVQFSMECDVALLYVNSWLCILESAEHRVISANNTAACNSPAASLPHRPEKDLPWVKAVAPLVSRSCLSYSVVTQHPYPHIS